MTRLGPWRPATIEERLDRMESLASIRQLPYRYALAIDSREQLERPDTGRWEVGELQYWDDYERVDGQWCFRRRKFHRWYLTDALARPAHGAGVNDGSDPLGARQLPEAFPTWAPYWGAPAS